MKNILTTLLLGAALSAFGQPVLQSSNIQNHLSYDVYQLSNITLSGLAPGGANAQWDASAATYTLVGSVSLVDPSSTPFGATYPDANVCMKLEAGATAVYHMMKSSGNGFEEVATDVSSSGAQTFLDFRLVMPASFHFGDSVMDTYQKNGQGPQTARLNYDAYGTLKLNDGTLNVGRVFRTTSQSQTDVWFWHENGKYPVMTINGSSATVWKPKTTTGVNEVANHTSFSIFPNPAADILHVSAAEEVRAISVYNTSGQLLISSSETDVALTGLPAGVYFIKVTGEHSSSVQKFCKL